jgi:hypothetical protein
MIRRRFEVKAIAIAPVRGFWRKRLLALALDLAQMLMMGGTLAHPREANHAIAESTGSVSG